MPFELVGEIVYLVIDAPTSTVKYVESLEHQWLGPVHLLDKQANNTRIRQRAPAPDKIISPKTSLIEELYKKTKQTFDTTK